MKEIGYDSVYQLDGGILKYFEEVGGEHYTATASCSTTPRPEPETGTDGNIFVCGTMVHAARQIGTGISVYEVSCPNCHDKTMP